MLQRVLTILAIAASLTGAAGAQPALAQASAAPAQGPAAPAQASAAPAQAWSVPDPDTLPDDAFGRTVRQGRDLIVKTSSLIGPDARDPAKHYSGNGLDCQSCHLQAGTQRFGLLLAGIWGVFPVYIARENEVRTLEERINGCMERSMNGTALPLDSPEMKAMLSYIRFISAPEQVGKSVYGRGEPPLALPETAGDPTHGLQVFTQACAACHGADGQGQRLEPAEAKEAGRRYRFPPLWGPDSFNDGAGMARAITAAQFVHANMPLGTTFEAPVLSPGDAFDVVAYISGQPRPHKAGLEADFPDRARKPVDAPYPPYIGPFTPDQHRLGPWPPIQEWVKANGAAARPTN
jgi:thiosulfate dehydrogenase